MSLGLRAIRPKRLQVVKPISDKESRAALREYLQEVKRQLMIYPPERPESTYIRKYMDGLQGAWVIRTPSRYYAELTNSQPYAAYVQGPTDSLSGGRIRQRSQFRRWGWKSITDVSRKTAPRFAEIMNRSIRTSAGGSNSLPLL